MGKDKSKSKGKLIIQPIEGRLYRDTDTWCKIPDS